MILHYVTLKALFSFSSFSSSFFVLFKFCKKGALLSLIERVVLLIIGQELLENKRESQKLFYRHNKKVTEIHFEYYFDY